MEPLSERAKGEGKEIQLSYSTFSTVLGLQGGGGGVAKGLWGRHDTSRAGRLFVPWEGQPGFLRKYMGRSWKERKPPCGEDPSYSRASTGRSESFNRPLASHRRYLNPEPSVF